VNTNEIHLGSKQVLDLQQEESRLLKHPSNLIDGVIVCNLYAIDCILEHLAVLEYKGCVLRTIAESTDLFNKLTTP
jgi:hypothetical protein